MVTNIPTQLAMTFERINEGRVRGLDSTQEAVPSLFSPTMASCIMIITPTAGNRPMNMNEIINESISRGGTLRIIDGLTKIPANPPQIRQWIHQVLVLNHLAKPLRSIFPKPRLQPVPLSNSKTSFPDILTSLDDLHEHIFQFILFAAEFGYSDRAINQQLEQLILSRLCVIYTNLPDA